MGNVVFNTHVTCSTVRGVQISSPLRIMDLWVKTSASWAQSNPRRSAALLRAKQTHILLLYINIKVMQLTSADYSKQLKNSTIKRKTGRRVEECLPDLEQTCAPPAVKNSMFPTCKIPDRSLNTSLMFSSPNCIVLRAF